MFWNFCFSVPTDIFPVFILTGTVETFTRRSDDEFILDDLTDEDWAIASNFNTRSPFSDVINSNICVIKSDSSPSLEATDILTFSLASPIFKKDSSYMPASSKVILMKPLEDVILHNLSAGILILLIPIPESEALSLPKDTSDILNRKNFI